jgi:hypothetical protein
MLRNLALGATMAAILVSSIPASGMSAKNSAVEDSSFSVFFDPDGTSLSKDGRTIVAIAAKRFAVRHNLSPAAHIFLIASPGSSKRPSVSNGRMVTISNALVQDGVRGQFVSVVERPGNLDVPISLQEWQNRRVSIIIRDNRDSARLLD